MANVLFLEDTILLMLLTQILPKCSIQLLKLGQTSPQLWYRGDIMAWPCYYLMVEFGLLATLKLCTPLYLNFELKYSVLVIIFRPGRLYLVRRLSVTTEAL